MIVIALSVGAAVFLALGWTLHVVYLELVKWFAERREDRKHLEEWGGDETADTTAWDHSDKSLTEVKADLLSAEEIKDMRVGRHRAEDRTPTVSTGRRIVHAIDGTFEIPLVPSVHPGFMVSRKGRDLAQERRRVRDRSAQSSDRPGSHAGEVPGALEVVLRRSKDRASMRQTVPRQAYERIPMPDWT